METGPVAARQGHGDGDGLGPGWDISLQLGSGSGLERGTMVRHGWGELWGWGWAETETEHQPMARTSLMGPVAGQGCGDLDTGPAAASLEQGLMALGD